MVTFGPALEVSAVMRSGRAIKIDNEQMLAVWLEEEEVLEDTDQFCRADSHPVGGCGDHHSPRASAVRPHSG